MSRSPIRAAAVLAALALSAAADDFGKANLSKIKSQAGPGAAAGKPVGAPPSQKVGRAAAAPIQKKVLAVGLYWINDKAVDIVDFVNDMGCVGAAGARAKLALDAFKSAAKTAQDATEVVYAPADQFSLLTTEKGAIAIGMTKELKALFAAEKGLRVGDPAKNSIIMNGDPPASVGDVPESGLGAHVLAHELLHIVLRSLENDHLGGGARKSDTGVYVTGQSSSGKDILFGEIANNHHHLTDYLLWKRVSWNQSTRAWTKRSPALECDAAFAQAQRETDADRASFTPKNQQQPQP
jgi:hypothetical protein